MEHIAKRKLEELLLSEATSFVDLRRAIQGYQIMTRFPDQVTEEELQIAKESILERWPEQADNLEVILSGTGNLKEANMSVMRAAKEKEREQRLRREPRVRERRLRTNEERLAKLSERKAMLTEKVKNKPKKDK